MQLFPVQTLQQLDDAQFATMLWSHLQTELLRVSTTLWPKWDIFTAYLKGHRRFDIRANDGTVQSHMLDKDGKLQHQLHDVVTSLNRVVGEMTSLDARPAVARETLSLAGLRNRATAQVIADAVSPGSPEFDTFKADLAFNLNAYGTVAVASQVLDDPLHGLSAHREVVDPHEIFPFPSTSYRASSPQGIIRRYFLPLQLLKERYGDAIESSLHKMATYSRYIGESQDISADPVSFDRNRIATGGVIGHFLPTTSQAPDAANVTTRAQHTIVEVVELWVYGPRGTCAYHAVASRDYVFKRSNYAAAGLVVYPSIARAICVKSGSFYGLGVCDIMFSLSRIHEDLIKTAINNVKDANKYPYTIIPKGVIHEAKTLQDNGDGGLRIVTYSPEVNYSLGNTPIRPITIGPNNPGSQLATQTAAYIQQTLDRTSFVRDIARDKGRIDSATGLQLLMDEARAPLTHPLQNYIRAITESHRYITVQSATIIAESPRPIPINHLTLDLLGAVVNFEDQTVTFERNPIPDVSRLTFGIRGTSSTSPSVKKQEASMWLQQGVQSPAEVRNYFLREGIDAAIYNDREANAWRLSIENILALFNDGETPGMIWFSPDTAAPDILYEHLNVFLAGPELRRASVEVINAFIDYRRQLQQMLGMVLPPQIPDELTTLVQASRNPQPRFAPSVPSA